LVASQYDVQHESRVKLNKILSFQKFHGNKCGVDFEKEASTSQNPPNSQGMIVFVPPIIAKESSPSLNSTKLDRKGNLRPHFGLWIRPLEWNNYSFKILITLFGRSLFPYEEK
jgi:hypothetical protein